MKAATKFSAVALASLAASCAYAQDSANDPAQNKSAAWYVGANVGQSRAKIDDNSISNALLDAGATSTSIQNDDRDTGYKIYGGYQFNDYLALEAGLFDLGKFGYTATTAPAATLDGTIRLKGLNLDLLGFVPLSENFSAFGRVGMSYARASDEFSSAGMGTVTDPDPRKTALNAKAGLGLQYRMTPSLAMRLEVERYRVDDAIGNKGDIDLISVGLVYRFGAVSPAPVAAPVVPPVVVVQVPEPVAVIAAPAPPPPPPTLVRVSFSADSLFGFNQANIQPAGKLAIDDFAAKLRGTHFERITVTGHTDRIGSHADNMILSMRRAETVKTYLIDSAGVPADKITALGVDGDDPVTRPGECVGNKKTRALIACLQPDRRVDLEVSGTQH